MLYLVGENITKYGARYRASRKQLQRLADGAYIDAAEEPAHAARRYALSLANYYFPNAYLTHASAYYQGPTPEGKLYVASGRGNLRKALPGLEIVVSPTKAHPQALTSFSTDEGERPITVKRVNDALLFLQMFKRVRLRDKRLPEDVIKAFAQAKLNSNFLVELQLVAGEHGMAEELGKAVEYLDGLQVVPKAARHEDRFVVGWFGRAIADLYHHNGVWRFEYRPGWTLRLSLAEDKPGQLPLFLQALLPEGWLLEVTAKRKEVDMLRDGYRYLSNITIAQDEHTLKSLPIDKLRGTLAQWSRKGVFNGAIDSSLLACEAEFESRIAKMWQERTMPRLSGVQLKVPVTLDEDGRLYAADKTPFTHILKVGLPSRYPEIGIVEWACMQVLNDIDVPTAATALLEIPGLPPACLVERFDIRGGDHDTRLVCTEDLASVLSIPTASKYDVSTEKAAKAVLAASTQPNDDAMLLLKQFFAAWLMGNGDLHVKNLSLLKIASPTLDRFEEVRLSPAYDMLCTKVFLLNDQLALPIGGKRDNLTDKTWTTFAAAVLKLRSAAAKQAFDEVASSLLRVLDGVISDVPSFARNDANDRALDVLRQIVEDRLARVPSLRNIAARRL